MAIFGIAIDRKNPAFTIDEFVLWMPQYDKFMKTEKGKQYFNMIYKIVNDKIFESIYGIDWPLAMSYAIAHYLTLIANQLGAPAGDSLESIAGGGTTQGVLASATVGSFSKTYELGATLVEEDESKWWNQTSYGQALMALLKTKAIPSIMVVTSGPAVPPEGGGTL